MENMERIRTEFAKTIMCCLDNYSEDTTVLISSLMTKYENVHKLYELVFRNPSEEHLYKLLKEEKLFEVKDVLTQQLAEECFSYPPDFKKMQSLVDRGADVNAIDEVTGFPLLYRVFSGYLVKVIRKNNPELTYKQIRSRLKDNLYSEYSGKYLKDIVKFFLKNGLDLNSQYINSHMERENVADTIVRGLTSTYADDVIIELLQLLLDNIKSAESLYFTNIYDDEKEYISSTFHESAHRAFSEAPHLAVIFETASVITERFREGKNLNISMYTQIIGKSVRNVYFYNNYVDLPLVYDYSDESGTFRNVMSGDLILDCEGAYLYFDENNFIFVENEANIDKTKLINANDYFSPIIGSEISGFDFIMECSTYYHQFGLKNKCIRFYNGKALAVCENYNINQNYISAHYFKIE